MFLQSDNSDAGDIRRTFSAEHFGRDVRRHVHFEVVPSLEARLVDDRRLERLLEHG